MKAWDYQVEIAKQVANMIRVFNICYLAMEERTGKSITMLEACEQLESVNKILIITKKKAMGGDPKEPPGWIELLDEYPLNKKYTLINYHSAKKIYNDGFDLVILDESHSYISGYPKTSALYKEIYKLVYGRPIIYSSATPYAQGPQLLY